MSRLGWVEGDDKFGEIEDTNYLDLKQVGDLMLVNTVSCATLAKTTRRRRRRARLELQQGNEERSRRQVLVWKAVLVFGL